METMTWHDIELPTELPEFNGFVPRWQEEPDDPIVDNPLENPTYDEACKRQRDVFEEQGLYKANYHFLKTALSQEADRVCDPLRSEWVEKRQFVPRSQWRSMPTYKLLRRERGRIGEAMRRNRKRWKRLSREYETELARVTELVKKLGIPIMEAKRKRRAELEAHDAKRRAEAKTDPRMRAYIEQAQRMTIAELRADLEASLKRCGITGLRAYYYIRDEIAAHEARMQRWRDSGLPYGEWPD